MSRPLVFVDGATGPELEVTFRRHGEPIDLSDYNDVPGSVVATIRRPGLAPLVRAMVVDADPTTGIARLSWQPGDLTATTKALIYEAEVRLDNGVGHAEVTPDPIRFHVRPRLT